MDTIPNDTTRSERTCSNSFALGKALGHSDGQETVDVRLHCPPRRTPKRFGPATLSARSLVLRRANCICFQQHSRFMRLNTFVFIDIFAWQPGFPQWSFVFNNIPASFVHFFKLLHSLSCGTPGRNVVVGQFAVAALSERRNSFRIQDRRSETAATKMKLTHYAECRFSASFRT